jgi:hypothetical protein
MYIHKFKTLAVFIIGRTFKIFGMNCLTMKPIILTISKSVFSNISNILSDSMGSKT